MTISESEKEFEAQCERYRKWIIKISAEQLTHPVLTVWFTDLSDHDTDKFIVTASNQIMGTNKLDTLIQYLKDHTKELPDPLHTLTWLSKIESLPYCNPYHQNLSIIEYALSEGRFNKKSILETVNFINLYNDYAHQLEDEELLMLSSSKEVRELWDFAYDEIIWKEIGTREELSAVRIPSFETNFDHLNVSKRLSPY